MNTEGATADVADFSDDSSPEDVAEAKSLGWKDPSEWKGAPPKNGFVKAADFVERGRTIVPIMRSQTVKLEKELADSKKELEAFKAEQGKKFENLSRMSKVALDRQREQLEAKYTAAIDAATEVGDKAEVQRLRKEEREEVKKFDAKDEDEPAKKRDDKKADELPAAIKDTLDAWVADNSWYNSEPEMQALANARHGKLLKDKPGLTLAENLAETREYIKKKFPEAFGKAEDDEEDDDKPARSRVEGGSRSGGGNGGSKFGKLPADARQQADRFIKEEGLFLEKGETAEKDLTKARERYAAQYLGETK